MTAFYNEIDPYAAQWLRNLIAAGHIAPGVVDERSIQDIAPDELKEFTQCHFFAGVGVWSLALRRAGWPDDRPVWTGSCPCQPFSAAGAGAGFSDLRHLWPDFAWQIDQCRPSVVFGEQVASKVVDTWVDLVQVDLETMGYAFGAIPFPSAGVGAPHIRDRLFWVANSQSDRHEWAGEFDESARRDGASHLRTAVRVEHTGLHDDAGKKQAARIGQSQANRSADISSGSGFPSGGMGNASSAGLEKRVSNSGILGGTAATGSGQAVERAGIYPGGMAESNSERLYGFDPLLQWEKSRRVAGTSLETSGCGPVNGFWGGADWISCRDDRFRPVEPGTFPLVNGAPSRVGRLRAYGNAINAQAAQEFIGAYLDSVSTKE